MRILVCGYYGYGNVGDEAVLEAIKKGFKQYLPGSEMVVLSAASPLNVTLQELKKVEVVVSGGGSLFQDVTSSWSFFYYLGMVWLAKFWGKKVMIFGQGFGPLRKKFNRWLARLILNQVDLITLRDEDSLFELGKIGVERPPIRVTADPSALLEVEDKSEGRKILGLEGIPFDKPLVGVAVRSIPQQPEAEEKLFKLLAEKLDSLATGRGFLPVFLLFQCPEDLRQASEVMRGMKEKVATVFRICRPDEMLSLFPYFEFVIAMRLHALIFAALNAVPMVGISYDPKVGSFMKSIGQPCVGLDEIDRLGIHIDETLTKKTEIKTVLKEKRTMLREKAKLNFDLFLDKFGGEK